MPRRFPATGFRQSLPDAPRRCQGSLRRLRALPRLLPWRRVERFTDEGSEPCAYRRLASGQNGLHRRRPFKHDDAGAGEASMPVLARVSEQSGRELEWRRCRGANDGPQIRNFAVRANSEERGSEAQAVPASLTDRIVGDRIDRRPRRTIDCRASYRWEIDGDPAAVSRPVGAWAARRMCGATSQTCSIRVLQRAQTNATISTASQAIEQGTKACRVNHRSNIDRKRAEFPGVRRSSRIRLTVC
jgi:hypothetical protein